MRVAGLISISIKGAGYTKKSKTYQILGCSFDEFAAHIERQFLPGMSWANRGEWHIDHIVAMATATTEVEALSLNHFTNLRPMWATDNISKGAKVLALL